MCEVVNQRDEHYDVYIGRGSFWGNPYKIVVDGTREEVISKYQRYLWIMCKENRDTMISRLLELEGEVLGCYCKPLPCHGDIILKAIKWARREKMKSSKKETVEITLVLNKHEASWLANNMQNPLQGYTPDNEPEEDRMLRREIFEACKQ